MQPSPHIMSAPALVGAARLGVFSSREEHQHATADTNECPGTRSQPTPSSGGRGSVSPTDGRCSIINPTLLLTEAAFLASEADACKTASPPSTFRAPPPSSSVTPSPTSRTVSAADLRESACLPPLPPPAPDAVAFAATSMMRRGVPHVYRDFSGVPEEPRPMRVRRKTGGVTQPFPEKLHFLLSKEHEHIGWLPHGRAFLVRDPHKFTDVVMPKYFRQTKLTSFQRQLNLYGFRRITQGDDAGAYYHEFFLRGRPALCYRMQRQKVKGTGHKQPADAQTEPDFYRMPICHADESQPEPDMPARSSSIDQIQLMTPERPFARPPSPAAADGLQSAAELLQTFASGAAASALHSPSLLERITQATTAPQLHASTLS